MRLVPPLAPARHRPSTRRRADAPSVAALLALAACGAPALVPRAAAAQQGDVPQADTASRWRGTARLDGNVLFGAARQRLVATTVAAGRNTGRWSLRGDATGSYADARDADDDAPRRVVARNGRVFAALDHDPRSWTSSFVFTGLESSLQQRIASRVTGGAGVKVVAWRGPRDDEVSTSLALLAERTRARREPGQPAGGTDAARGEGNRVRWSLRARWRRQLTPTLRVSHVTFYQPTVNAVQRYTVETTTTIASPLRRGLDLTGTLLDRYDSEARRRGARSNHDGQLLFGLRASF